jgi:hypothetical protein
MDIVVFLEKEKGLTNIKKMLEKVYNLDTYCIGEKSKYMIEEMYIEKNGNIYISCNGNDDLYYSITIPFEEWFHHFLRFKSFEELKNTLENKKEKIKETKKILNEIINRVE